MEGGHTQEAGVGETWMGGRGDNGRWPGAGASRGRVTDILYPVIKYPRGFTTLDTFCQK